MSPFLHWAFWVLFSFTACAWIAGISYGIGYAWAAIDQRRASRRIVVAEGEFDAMTHGVRQFVRLRDGRSFPLVLAHAELDLEPGERVRVLRNGGSRHSVERAA